jgi:hypothetical protein
MRRHVLTAVAALFGLVVLSLWAGLVPERASASSRPRATHLRLGHLGNRPVVRIRDSTVRRSRPFARAADARYGGRVQASDGETVTVFLSPAYLPDYSVLQSAANFFVGLIHGAELADLTVYMAPLEEMVGICGNEADACYDPGRELIVLVGSTPPDGTPLEEIASHEYGHHIAFNRNNAPWAASAWGPKYWSTEEDVCNLVRAGVAFPGAEGANYGLNPGEAWAETYRVLNGGSEPWTRVDSAFYPDGGALYWARQDVLNPFPGNSTGTASGRFRRGGSRLQSILLPVDNDGSVTIRLVGARAGCRHRALRAPPAPRPSGAQWSHRDAEVPLLRIPQAEAARVPLSGLGRFRVRASLPYDNPKVP